MKRFKLIQKKIEKKEYDSLEAFQVLIENAKAYESIDIACVLGIDPKKSDQVVKGLVENVPSGLGRKISVAVFTKNNVENLKKIADFVGFEDLIKDVKEGKVDADVYITTKAEMAQLSASGIARTLKSKLPNPKNGTVIENEKDLEKAVKMQKFGQIKFRSNEKIIHVSIGRATFTAQELNANYEALMEQIIKSKPAVVKPNVFVQKIYTSATMSPSILLKNLTKGAKNG